MASTVAVASAHTLAAVGLTSRAAGSRKTRYGAPACVARTGAVTSSSQSISLESSGLRGGYRRPALGSLYQTSRKARKGVVTAEVSDKPSGSSTGKFVTGFLIGGVVLGVLGYFFAPQISKTLLGENEDGTPRRLPRWLDEEDSLEATRKSLNEKIAQLNAAIDDVSAQLRADETADEELETSL